MALGTVETIIDIDGRELLQHGEPSFPIAFYNDNIKELPVPWHWHDELEIGVVTRGEILMRVDTAEYILKEGEGFFINSSVLHEVWNYKDAEGELKSMVFHPRIVGSSVDSVYWQNYVQPLLDNISLKELMLYPENEWHEEIMSCVRDAWFQGAYEPEGYEFGVRNALSRIIFLLTKHNKNPFGHLPTKALREETRIKKMLQFIQEHYSEEIMISEIAQSASISESECLRCFKNMIGTTPIQFLRDYRLRKAATLLKTTCQKVVDIGILCGFQDMSYFAKSFRKVYGCTPSQYRRNEEKSN